MLEKACSFCLSLNFPIHYTRIPSLPTFSIKPLSLLFCGPSASRTRRPRWAKTNPARNVARRVRPRFFCRTRGVGTVHIRYIDTILWHLAKVSFYTMWAAHCVSKEGVTVNESFFRDKKQEGGWLAREGAKPQPPLSFPGEGDILPPIN